VVGQNGSGKSTLLNIMAGALSPTSGIADLDGVQVAKWQRGDQPPPVGFMADEPSLIEGTVAENIARFGESSLLSVANSAIKAGVHETLQGLASGYDTPVGPNGSGLALRERRAVALARAMHGGPRIVVLDEPEIGLDGSSLRRLMAVLKEAKAGGTSLVIATQDPRLLSLCDDLLVLDMGSLRAFGPSTEVTRTLSSQHPPAAADKSGA
jgi:ATP-binding cassette subfamily C exporter for protease/lipase